MRTGEGEIMKIVKGIFITVITIFVALVVIVAVNGDSNDYARITELEYKAVVVDEVGSKGKVVITERLTFDIHAASSNNLFWELWRDLPEEYIDGVKVDYKVNYVKQIFADGTELVYDESPWLYWDDWDYLGYDDETGPGKWFHSKGPYDNEYNFECVLFYVDGLYRETVVFEIQYEMYNASMRYNDSSELYVSLYYGKSIEYLKSVKGQILFPSNKMPRAGNYDAHTYGTNSHEFSFVESDSINPGFHTFSFELNESQLKFMPYNQFVEFALIAHGEDKHIFTNYAEVNDYYDRDMLAAINKAQNEYELLPSQTKRNKTIFLVVSIISSLGVLGLAFIINATIKKKNKFYKPFMELEFFRDIPSDLDANFASRLVFCKHNKKDDIGDGYSAAMLSLVNKGYIELLRIDPTKKWSSKNVKIVITHQQVIEQPLEGFQASDELNNQSEVVVNRVELSPIEERYFNLIVRHAKGGEISHINMQKKITEDYEYTNNFVKGIESSLSKIGVTDSYFQKADYKSPKNTMRVWSIVFVICAIICVLFGNLLIYYQTRLDIAYGSFFILGLSFIIGAFYLRVVSKQYFLLTQFGEDEYTKWRALYNFLNSATLMKEREVLELVIWEKYLIYATAFGISEKVIKALKIRCPETVMENSTILANPYFRNRMYHSNFSRSFNYSASSARFSSRSGGFSGYGGGGRGGGGGGGGH